MDDSDNRSKKHGARRSGGTTGGSSLWCLSGVKLSEVCRDLLGTGSTSTHKTGQETPEGPVLGKARRRKKRMGPSKTKEPLEPTPTATGVEATRKSLDQKDDAGVSVIGGYGLLKCDYDKFIAILQLERALVNGSIQDVFISEKINNKDDQTTQRSKRKRRKKKSTPDETPNASRNSCEENVSKNSRIETFQTLRPTGDICDKPLTTNGAADITESQQSDVERVTLQLKKAAKKFLSFTSVAQATKSHESFGDENRKINQGDKSSSNVISADSGKVAVEDSEIIYNEDMEKNEKSEQNLTTNSLDADCGISFNAAVKSSCERGPIWKEFDVGNREETGTEETFDNGDSTTSVKSYSETTHKSRTVASIASQISDMPYVDSDECCSSHINICEAENCQPSSAEVPVSLLTQKSGKTWKNEVADGNVLNPTFQDSSRRRTGRCWSYRGSNITCPTRQQPLTAFTFDDLAGPLTRSGGTFKEWAETCKCCISLSNCSDTDIVNTTVDTVSKTEPKSPSNNRLRHFKNSRSDVTDFSNEENRIRERFEPTTSSKFSLSLVKRTASNDNNQQTFTFPVGSLEPETKFPILDVHFRRNDGTDLRSVNKQCCDVTTSDCCDAASFDFSTVGAVTGRRRRHSISRCILSTELTSLTLTVLEETSTFVFLQTSCSNLSEACDDSDDSGVARFSLGHSSELLLQGRGEDEDDLESNETCLPNSQLSSDDTVLDQSDDVCSELCSESLSNELSFTYTDQVQIAENESYVSRSFREGLFNFDAERTDDNDDGIGDDVDVDDVIDTRDLAPIRSSLSTGSNLQSFSNDKDGIEINITVHEFAEVISIFSDVVFDTFSRQHCNAVMLLPNSRSALRTRQSMALVPSVGSGPLVCYDAASAMAYLLASMMTWTWSSSSDGLQPRRSQRVYIPVTHFAEISHCDIFQTEPPREQFRLVSPTNRSLIRRKR